MYLFYFFIFLFFFRTEKRNVSVLEEIAIYDPSTLTSLPKVKIPAPQNFFSPATSMILKINKNPNPCTLIKIVYYIKIKLPDRGRLYKVKVTNLS